MLERYKYIEVEKLIEHLKDDNKETIQDKAIYCLTYRIITESECEQVLEHFGISLNSSIKSEVNKMVDMFYTGCTIDELSRMNYVETDIFLGILQSKGVRKETIIDELYNLWDEGRINGFNFRYTVEVLGEQIPEKFLKEAKETGRYYL